MNFPLKRFPKLALAAVHTRNPLAHRIVARLPRKRLDRPVFIVGLPRSGTSIFVRLLADTKHLAQWSEAPVVWDPRWRDRTNDHRWTAEHATPDAVRRIDNNFAWYTAWKGQRRFLNKHPRNALRVPFLVAGWPDGLLLDLQRDPRAVVNSLVDRTRRETWRHAYPLGQFARPPGWREIDAIEDDVEKFSRMVDASARTLREDLAAVPDPSRVFSVRYEDFAEDVRGTLRRVYDFCDVPIDEAGLARAPERLENMNWKWMRDRTPDEIRTMHRILGPLLVESGYEADDAWLDAALDPDARPAPAMPPASASASASA